MKRFLSFFLLSVISLSVAYGQTLFPEGDFKPAPSPLASEFAEPGGNISFWASQYPGGFNYTILNSSVTYRMFSQMYETLLTQDSITLEDRPNLAEKWEISEDKLEYTFYLNKKAEWSDGTPVTSADVIWTFHAMKNPAHKTGPYQVTMKRLISCEAIDDHTVKITANKVHWKNLTAASSFFILPKHWWEKQEFNEVKYELPIVSGPYKLGKVIENHSAKLVKRDDYWNKDNPAGEGLGNFDTIDFRFYTQRDTAYEAFKKGDLDTYAVYTSSRWMKETKGERFDKNWIVKQSIYNQNPVGFQGFAMNQRKAPFNDKRVRKALAHLVDRKRMNSTIMFNQYVMTSSYYPDLWTKEKPNPNKETQFDIEKARQLLKEAGYEINKKTGKLEKDGKPFIIQFLTSESTSSKFLLIFEEALKDVGIDLEIKLKSRSAWTEEVFGKEYEMTWFSWGASVSKDPEPNWHSSTVDIEETSNITGFANEEVDKLIESTRELFDVEKRHDVVRKIDAILYEETPYILLWHIDYVRMLYWNKFGTPDQVLGKFNGEEDSVNYWWNDEFQAGDLEAARESGDALPAVDRIIKFDEMFSGGTNHPVQSNPLQ